MNTTGWILMLGVWTGITVMLAYCLFRVLKTRAPVEGPYPMGDTDGDGE